MDFKRKKNQAFEFHFGVKVKNYYFIPVNLLYLKVVAPLSAQERRVLEFLETFANAKRPIAYPSVDTISVALDIKSKQSVSNTLASLEAKGFIVIDKGGRKGNKYDLSPFREKLAYAANLDQKNPSKLEEAIETFSEDLNYKNTIKYIQNNIDTFKNENPDAKSADDWCRAIQTKYLHIESLV